MEETGGWIVEGVVRHVQSVVALATKRVFALRPARYDFNRSNFYVRFAAAISAQPMPAFGRKEPLGVARP